MFTFLLARGTVLVVSCMCAIIEADLYLFLVSRIEMIAREHRVSGQILKKLYDDIQRSTSVKITLNTLANTRGVAIAISFGVLVFSEIIPKTAGVVYARSLARLIAYPIHWLVWIFSPFIRRLPVNSRRVYQAPTASVYRRLCY